MRNKNRVFILLGVIICLMILYAFVNMNIDTESFDFSLGYGYFEENQMSTYDNTFTCMTVIGKKTIKIHLSKGEKKRIQEFIKSNNLLEQTIPVRRIGDLIIMGQYNSATLQVNFNEQKSSFTWAEYTKGSYVTSKVDGKIKYIPIPGNEKNFYRIEKLNELVDLVDGMVYSHRAAKQLPERVNHE